MKTKLAYFHETLNDYIEKGILLDRISCVAFSLGFFDSDGNIPVEVITRIFDLAEQGKIKY